MTCSLDGLLGPSFTFVLVDEFTMTQEEQGFLFSVYQKIASCVDKSTLNYGNGGSLLIIRHFNNTAVTMLRRAT